LVSGTCRFCAGCRSASMRRHTVAARRHNTDVKQVASTPMMDVKVRGQACSVSSTGPDCYIVVCSAKAECPGSQSLFFRDRFKSHIFSPWGAVSGRDCKRVSSGGSSGNVLCRGTCAVHRPFPVYRCFTDWSSPTALKGKGMRLGPTTLCGPRHVVRHAA
jgi:hypothetical protein